MDITQLRYFLAAAETLNYTRAAKKLYISRQALRQALAAMETELHVPLFINRHNKLSLTAAEEYLQTAGQEVVGAFDQMMEGAGGFARQKNTIKVALAVSLFPFLLPEDLAGHRCIGFGPSAPSMSRLSVFSTRISYCCCSYSRYLQTLNQDSPLLSNDLYFKKSSQNQ